MIWTPAVIKLTMNPRLSEGWMLAEDRPTDPTQQDNDPNTAADLLQNRKRGGNQSSPEVQSKSRPQSDLWMQLKAEVSINSDYSAFKQSVKAQMMMSWLWKLLIG